MIILYTLTTEEIENKNSRIEILLMSLANGNNAKMGELYDLIKTDVFAFALSKTGNKFDAEDIMQDTFVKIYKNAKLYTPKGKPMAWIITVELNIIRRYFQLKQRVTSLDDSYSNLSAGEDLEQKTVNQAFLQEMLSKLTESEREVVSLHIVTGLKHREIAKLLDKPLSTVLSKYNRAIKKLQAIVKEKK